MSVANSLCGYRTPIEFDMALQEPSFWILHKGMRVDLAKRKEIAIDYQRQLDNYYPMLDKLVGCSLLAKKGLSNKRIMTYLYGALKIKERTKKKKPTADEDALRAIMAEAAEQIQKLKTTDSRVRWQRAYLSIRLILKIKKLEKNRQYVEEALDGDNRARCSENVGGARTARWSHNSTPWNTGNNRATVPLELRELYIPDEGYELAEFDLNRGESWIYSYLSLDPELIRIHSSFGDFHAETASAISTAFGDTHYSVGKIKELYKSGDSFGYRIRYLGKKVNHASAYRMGAFRGAEVVNEEADDTGITVTPSQFAKAQKLWKAKYIMIPQGWWPAIDLQIKEKRMQTTPYGRVFRYWDWLDDSLMKEATSHVPQSTSVDYLNCGLLTVFRDLVLKGFCDLLHQQHDSIVIQYPINRRNEVLGEVKSRLERKIIVNDHEIMIPVEAKYGQNWKEMTEWKN